jgi:small conductance mechanosensitive channel
MRASMARHVRERAAYSAQRARRARRQAAVLLPLIVGVFLAYKHREELFGVDLPVRVAAILALVVLGWPSPATWAGSGPQPVRADGPGDGGDRRGPGPAGDARVLRVDPAAHRRPAPRTLAVGGAITAVIVGLAARQTIGNLIPAPCC